MGPGDPDELGDDHGWRVLVETQSHHIELRKRLCLGKRAQHHDIAGRFNIVQPGFIEQFLRYMQSWLLRIRRVSQTRIPPRSAQ
jgi:hypothetical protein